ncbi:hypothetical protein Cgig2_026005 [Carnegiea gigantea]|uniref:Uncharacterized protein n=1 Tax=Carnegiea gigantea TaxID=171969 RepID=A0A9Q1K170_9CARY|nr:hypothetical protein Cgig2_026005 [Carnegiea gigantea]
MAMKEVLYDIHNTLVADYWDANRGWQWEKFSNYLTSEALCKIASHELINDAGAEDKLYWKGDKAGKCKIKSVFGMFRGDPITERNDSWAWKWRNSICFDKAKSIPSNKPMFLLERFHVILDTLAVDDSWNGKRTREETEILDLTIARSLKPMKLNELSHTRFSIVHEIEKFVCNNAGNAIRGILGRLNPMPLGEGRKGKYQTECQMLP